MWEPFDVAVAGVACWGRWLRRGTESWRIGLSGDGLDWGG